MKAIRIDAVTGAAAWMIVSGICVLAGWGLSVAGWLGAEGYATVAAIALATAVFIWRRTGVCWVMRLRMRRYGRGYPAIFAGAWLLACIGGCLHAPNNIDAMAYRVPRVLHWLAEGRWHWIDTVDPRMNYSGCGQEWLVTPLMAWMNTDRWIWLWNALALALLPGLVFVVLRGLGVARRVAWRWMWLLPLAPVYFLQAGSVANDLIGTTYFGAALALGIVARRGGSVWALVFSVLAMALCTGVKSSNLPLVLPWLVMIGPGLRTGRAVRAVSGAMMLAVIISIVPTLWLNHHHTGDWRGDPTNTTALSAGGPLSGVVGNTIQAVLQNAQPPVFPLAAAVEKRLEATLGVATRAWLDGDFPRFSVHLTELAQEEWSGLGGLFLLLLAGAYVVRRRETATAPADKRRRAVGVAAIVATLAYFTIMGSEMTARLMAPYYLLLAAGMLSGSAQTRWVRSRTFGGLAALAIIGSLVPLVIAPARPLVPVSWLLEVAQPMNAVAPGVIARAEKLYDVYAQRADLLRELCNGLPTEVSVVGFMATADDSEISGWRPFGSRRVVTVRPTDDATALRARSVQWLLVRADAFWSDAAERGAWLKARKLSVFNELQRFAKARRETPEHWLLVRMSP